MSFHEADSLSVLAFSIFATVMFGLIIYAFRRAAVQRSAYFVFLGYLVLLSGAAGSGLMSGHVLPMMPLVFISNFAVGVWLAFSISGKRIANTFSLPALIGFQAFRFPLELILHHWANIGTIPATMTWSGQNWDVVSGITCLVLGPFASRSRAMAWTAQSVGFLLLINVGRVVILSSPLPFSWSLENPLQLAIYLPYAFILPLFVLPAFVGHLVIFRKLLNGTTKI